MNFITNFFKGILIGSGAIIPGVSSGVICVILGIYETLLDRALHIFNNFKENIKFFLPIMLGCGIGVILFGNILKYLLDVYAMQTNYLFIGLILGSLPALFKEVNSKQKFKLRFTIPLLLSFGLGIIMVFLEHVYAPSDISETNLLYLFLCGSIMSLGVIIPGISSTLILMILGVYNIYISAIATIYIPVLLSMGIGLIIGCIIVMNITQTLLDRHYAPTFYSIIGFTIGSIFVLYPGFSFDINGCMSILCLIIGALVSKLF